MSQTSIRKALEQGLAALTQLTVDPLDVAIAWENAVYTPVDGTPYIQANMLWADPDNQTQGGAVWFERGIFQLTLKYPTGKGTADAGAAIETIKDAFARCETFTSGGITVLITDTPRVSAPLPDPSRYAIAVSIPWQAQVAR